MTLVDRLVQTRGSQTKDEWELPRDRPIVVGRYDSIRGFPEIDLSSDRKVSRRHARIWFENQHWWVTDIGSRHGVFVDGTQVAKGQRLRILPGVDLRIGDTFLTFFPADWQTLFHDDLLFELCPSPVVSYATVFAGMSVLTHLAVRNLGTGPSAASAVKIDIAEVGSTELDLPPLLPEERRVLEAPPVTPDARALLARTRHSWQLGRLTVGCRAASMRVFGIRVLAFNEQCWEAPHWMLLAGFVLPNHPVVVRLASGVAGGSADPRQLLQQLYQHLATDWSLEYRFEPASPDANTQKIRLPHQILAEPQGWRGAGTCLDLAILIAAVLEHSGLQPLIAIAGPPEARHALVGVWRRNGPRLEPIIADIGSVINEAEWIDPNGCTRDPSQRCLPQDSSDRAVRFLREQRLVYVLDVAAARTDGVEPLDFPREPSWNDQVIAVLDESARVAEFSGTRQSMVTLLIGIMNLPRVEAALEVSGFDVNAAICRLTSGLEIDEREIRAPSSHYVQTIASARARAEAAGVLIVDENDFLSALLDTASDALDRALDSIEMTRATLRGIIGPGDEEMDDVSVYRSTVES